MFLALRYRRGIVAVFTAPGRGAAIGTVCMALAQVCVIWAFLHTNVANVVFVFGALPFVSGVLAWLLLREPIRTATWMAMCLAFGGIGLMTVDELGAGRYLGNLLAIATTLFYGGLVVTARVSRASDMAPVLCSGALLACVICALLVESFAIGWRDFLLCAVMGGVQTFFSYWLMDAGGALHPRCRADLARQRRAHPRAAVGVARGQRDADLRHHHGRRRYHGRDRAAGLRHGARPATPAPAHLPRRRPELMPVGPG